MSKGRWCLHSFSCFLVSLRSQELSFHSTVLSIFTSSPHDSHFMVLQDSSCGSRHCIWQQRKREAVEAVSICPLYWKSKIFPRKPPEDFSLHPLCRTRSQELASSPPASIVEGGKEEGVVIGCWVCWPWFDYLWMSWGLAVYSFILFTYLCKYWVMVVPPSPLSHLLPSLAAVHF